MGANNDSLSGTMTVSDISADGEAEVRNEPTSAVIIKCALRLL